MSDSRSGAIFKVGDVLNNTYRIEAVLGRGGTSEVYEARSEISGHRFALKALRHEFSDNEDFLNLMKREEEIREIRHDAIVRYFHNQRTADGVVFLIMDYVEGPGLDRKMKEGGMSAADLLTVAERVAEGLHAAHSKHIVHRDLSPDNIILRNGEPSDAVIIDFGIAKDSNPGAQTVVGNEFAGKYAYAAPEQLSGNSDVRSDLYALGALLLATFRGVSPSVGRNPLEMIEGKSRPLDTDGVPEPLKGLIDRMTNPDPGARFQTAGDLLAALRRDGTPPVTEPETDDRTVVAMPLQGRGSATGKPTAGPGDWEGPRKPERAAPAKFGGGRGLLAALGLLVVAGGLGGGYYSGGFDSLLSPVAVADPFTLTVEKSEDGAVSARGFVPTEDLAETLRADARAAGGSADLTVARGDIGPGWGEGIGQLIDVFGPLPEWRLSAEGNAVEISGLTEDRAEQQALNGMTLPAPFTGEVAVELGPRILTVSRLEAILQENADCGDLRLSDPPAAGYPNGADVVVTGKVASRGTEQALFGALTAVAGDRTVRVEVEELNPTLCLIDQALPAAPPGGFTIGFADGETGARNPSGRFVVGQNPVIDVTIPGDVTEGYLYVSALDVSGNVFHLLPNVYIEDNTLETLRGGQDGPVLLRVAHTLADRDASDGRKLAFQVDDSALGKTEIVVIHADAPILNGTRPITESAEGFAQALRERSGPVRSLDSRILETALP